MQKVKEIMKCNHGSLQSRDTSFVALLIFVQFGVKAFCDANDEP